MAGWVELVAALLKRGKAAVRGPGGRCEEGAGSGLEGCHLPLEAAGLGLGVGAPATETTESSPLAVVN
jgi:hypothetical protein